MGLDNYDLEVIQTEAKILGAKIDGLNDRIDNLTTVLIQLRQNQAMTNALLEKIADYTSELVPHTPLGPR